MRLLPPEPRLPGGGGGGAFFDELPLLLPRPPGRCCSSDRLDAPPVPLPGFCGEEEEEEEG